MESNIVKNNFNVTIYCEIEEQPKSWMPNWNSDAPVVWEYTE